MPDPLPPDPSQVAPQAPAPDLGSADPSALTPQLQGSPGSRTTQVPPRPGRPILMDLIQGLFKPPMQASAPGQIARPVSRVDTLESFLGNFIGALGQGMANAGTGPGANFRGAGAAIQGPYRQAVQDYQLQQQKAVQDATIEENKARTAQTQAQTAAIPVETQAKVDALTARPRTDPDSGQDLGSLTDKGFADYIKTKTANAGKTAVANINKRFIPVQGVGLIDTQAPGGPVPVKGSAQGVTVTPELAADYNLPQDAIGKPMKLSELASFQRQNQTSVSYRPVQTSPGVFQNLPSTTIKGTGGAPRVTGVGVPRTAGGTPSGFPKSQASGGTGGKIYGDVTGYAFDPASGETRLTNPQEADRNHYIRFRKALAPEIQADTQLNNRLADVATKITRYEDTINTPIRMGDKYVISKILGEDKLKAGISHVEIPVDFMNQIDKARNLGQISPAAQNRLISYYNARESMQGYQAVLSKKGGSDKGTQLNLDALPNPIAPDDYSREALRQFKENVTLAGRGIPRMPGVPNASDIFQGKGGSNIPQAPSGKLDSLIKKYGGK